MIADWPPGDVAALVYMHGDNLSLMQMAWALERSEADVLMALIELRRSGAIAVAPVARITLEYLTADAAA